MLASYSLEPNLVLKPSELFELILNCKWTLIITVKKLFYLIMIIFSLLFINQLQTFRFTNFYDELLPVDHLCEELGYHNHSLCACGTLIKIINSN